MDFTFGSLTIPMNLVLGTKISKDGTVLDVMGVGEVPLTQAVSKDDEQGFLKAQEALEEAQKNLTKAQKALEEAKKVREVAWSQARKPVSQRLKLARVLRGLKSAYGAARFMQIAAPTYLDHESGGQRLRPDMATYYAEIFGVTKEFLFSGVPPEVEK